MSQLTVLDPFLLMWDRNDFEIDSTKYYILAGELVELFNILDRAPLFYVLREELLTQMINEFPTCEFSESFPELFDVVNAIYSFLDKISSHINQYPSCVDEEINVDPEFCKKDAPQELQEEIKYLSTEMFSNEDITTYITLERIWCKASLIKLSRKDWIKSIPVFSSLHQISCELEKYQRKFEESPKHRVLGGWDTKLDIIIDTVNQLLRGAVAPQEGQSNALYNFSREDKKFIAYRPHRDNLFHAYPVKSTEVPPDVKKKLIENNEFKGKKTKVLKGNY